MHLDTVLAHPELAALLGIALYALKYYQRGLGWYDYRTLHGLKVRLAPIIDRWVFAVSEKGYRDDAEYLDTVDTGVKATWQALVETGDPHLVNSVKRRVTPDGVVQYSRAHVVWFHGDTDADGEREQTEAYLFANADGSADVYAHYEGSFTDAEDHLHGGQTDGDPHGVVRDALGLGHE